MQQSATNFVWTEPRRRAAALVADDELTDEQIASSVGVHRVTLHRWKEHPAFNAEVAHYIEDLNRAMLKLDIAKKRKRVARLDVMEKKLWQIIEERAADYAADAEKAVAAGEATDAQKAFRNLFGITDGMPAGGGTGFITKTIKQIGAGRTTQLISEFGVATDIVKTIMALHEQAAKELGQWSEKLEVDQTTTVFEIVGVNAERI